jgi:hypothetical protein
MSAHSIGSITRSAMSNEFDNSPAGDQEEGKLFVRPPWEDFLHLGVRLYVCKRHRPNWQWTIAGSCPLCENELEEVAYVPNSWLFYNAVEVPDAIANLDEVREAVADLENWLTRGLWEKRIPTIEVQLGQRELAGLKGRLDELELQLEQLQLHGRREVRKRHVPQELLDELLDAVYRHEADTLREVSKDAWAQANRELYDVRLQIEEALRELP